MNYFQYQEQQLFAEDVSVAGIANRYGTPTYIYSKAAIVEHFSAYQKACNAIPHLICYAVKANSNIAILSLLSKLGAGFDIVSGGELDRVIAAGGAANKIVFSGVGKNREEIRKALELGVRCFNIESTAELSTIDHIAGELGKTASISLRVNPDVDAHTHPYISTGLKENKFGIDIEEALPVYRIANAMEHVEIKGVDCHIGSQLTELTPFLDAMDRVLLLVDELQKEGVKLQHIDLGGGLGVNYNGELPPTPEQYTAAIVNRLGNRDIELILEPGRSIVANAGILLTKVELLKTNGDKHFAVVDAAMNDLLRPSLYGAWQDIFEANRADHRDRQRYDIVGPICETGDFLGKDRDLAINAGDLLSISGVGAYGFCMSSNYNSRNRAAEVLVSGTEAHLIRRRETLQDELAKEYIPPT